MTVDQHVITAELWPVNLKLAVKTAEITLDEAWSPYGHALIVCSVPDDLDRSLVDLRENDLRLDLRVRQDFGRPIFVSDLTLTSAGSIAGLTDALGGRPLRALTNGFSRGAWNKARRTSVGRRFNMMVTSRTFDDVAHELTIEAFTDEQLLLGDALIAGFPLDPGSTSLREVCRQVLTRYGSTLHDDSLDATVAEAAATIWQPGVGAWDYLNPMLEAASLRLWSDETGVFHIGERQSTSPGAITIAPGGTMTGLTDKMTHDAEIWYDAVVVEYKFGGTSTFDAAGASPSKSVLHLVRDNTKYPGPGAATGILQRARGRGRVLDLTAVSDYRVTPGMAATIRPVDSPTQTGYVAAVSWRFPAAEMSIPTRALVDTPPTAYVYGPAGLSYNEVPAGVSYAEFDWSLI